jgi:hypothetical protein
MWYHVTAAASVYTGLICGPYRRVGFWAGFCYVRGRGRVLLRALGCTIEQCERLGGALSAVPAVTLLACAR